MQPKKLLKILGRAGYRLRTGFLYSLVRLQMDSDLEGFLKTLELNSIDLNELPDHVGELARFFVNENNVREILKILAKSRNGGANLSFWAHINEAPHTEEDWETLQFIGGGITSDGNSRMKTHFRRAVEATRKFVGDEQIRRDLLFRSKI